MRRAASLPAWAELTLVPVCDLSLALAAAALVVAAIGVGPLDALSAMIEGAFGDAGGLGYTLYYATNLVFTGLAVAVAYQAGLFNIGGEGQAALGGLGAALVGLAFDDLLPPIVLLPLALVSSALFGAAWAAVPAWLQASRGSHVVITTIMFNFIASALLVYLLVNVLIAPGSMTPETRTFGPAASMPTVASLAALLGVEVTPSPLNVAALVALLAALAVWLLIWHTRLGFAMRVLGANPGAALYSGISTTRVTIVALCLSGALAGLVGVNEILGVQHRLILNASAGYGFAGIAVALMGRNHPVGIVLASLLFGALYQGGAEMTFAIPQMSREMVLVVQGLVILVSGAMAGISRPLVGGLIGLFSRAPAPARAA